MASHAGDPCHARDSQVAPGRDAETQPPHGVNSATLWLICHVPSSGVKSN